MSGSKNDNVNSIFSISTIKKRMPWTHSEDSYLNKLVHIYGLRSWTQVAKEMSARFTTRPRTGKQCRERWHNHLDPSITKKDWSAEEERVLFTKQEEYGNKWCQLAEFLPGRTDNAIKNHYYSKLRKLLRKTLKTIIKDGLIDNSIINKQGYTADKLYNDIKDQDISFNDITKEFVIQVIINNEKKNLNKTRRKKKKQQTLTKNKRKPANVIVSASATITKVKNKKEEVKIFKKENSLFNNKHTIVYEQNNIELPSTLIIETNEHREEEDEGTAEAFSNQEEHQNNQCKIILNLEEKEASEENESNSQKSLSESISNLPDIFEISSHFLGSESRDFDRYSAYNDAFSIRDSDLMLSPVYLTNDIATYSYDNNQQLPTKSLFKQSSYSS